MDGENGMLTMEDYSEVGVIDRNDEYVNNANNVMSPITAAAIMAVDEGGDTSSGESGSEYNSIDDEENDVDVTVKHMKEHGVDMQGIDWTNVYCSRADFRRSRNKSVQPFRSVNDSLNSVISIPEDQMLKQDPRFTFFSFVSSRLSEKCAFLHFQLRHLLSSPSKVQVFYANLSSIRRWNPVSRKSEHILDAQNIPNMEPVRISSMAASKECIFVGGFMGEVLIKPLYQNNVHLYQQASRDAGSIINHISVCSLGPSFTFEEKVCLSCNDKSIKILDLRKLVSETILQLPFPVNASLPLKEKNMI